MKFKCGFCGTITEGEIISAWNAGHGKHTKVSNAIVCKKCLNHLHHKEDLVEK